MGAPRFVLDRFWPSNLFLGGIPGAWYDPTDLSTMFQDSTGTTPVTAVEQPVGLILDKSQGLALGPELVTNGDFSGGTTGWTGSNATLSIVGGALRFTVTANGQAGAYQQIATTAGRTYKATFTFVADAANGNTFFNAGTTTTGAQLASINCGSTTGTYTMYFVATGAISYISVVTSSTALAGQTNDVTGFTVRELAGNHASQSTAASRPTYRARYNMVEQSEAFNNAWWTKIDTTISSDAGVAPDGTTTADLMYPTTSGSDRFVWRTPAIVGINGQSYTVSVYAKASGKSFLWFATLGGNTLSAQLAFFNLQTGQVTQVGAYFDAVTIQSVGSGWYRCTATKNVVLSANLYPIFGVSNASGSSAVTTNGTDGILIWGAQLLTAADVTATGNAYQRIAAATVYDTAPIFRPYLAFDGLDDSLSTAAINFTATDKMTVFGGVTKFVDAIGVITELSADKNANNGVFFFNTDAAPRWYWTSKGTVEAGANSGAVTTFPAPSTSVVTNTGDISAPLSAVRVNGVFRSSSALTQGTGNYGNYPLFIGRRNNASLPFNGRLFSLIVRGAASSVTEIADTELWVNARTGAY